MRYTLIVTIRGGVELDSSQEEIFWKTSTQETKEHFDTLQEACEIIRDYEELYKDEVPPVEIPEGNYWRKTRIFIPRSKYYALKDSVRLTQCYYQRPCKDYSEGKRYWAWILLDLTEEKVHSVGGHKAFLQELYGKGDPKKSLALRDRFFRGPTEIPKDYLWDPGEYEGWLRFRWGDGKNSLKLPPPEKKKEPIEDTLIEEATEDDLRKYIINLTE